MDVSKPYEFIGFGAMDVSKPYDSQFSLGSSSKRAEICPESFGIVVFRFVSNYRAGFVGLGLGSNPVQNRRFPAGSSTIFGALLGQQNPGGSQLVPEASQSFPRPESGRLLVGLPAGALGTS